MAPSESKSPSPTQLDDLADDELFQVLVRVPQKTARIIRAVARRWNSIICSPSYAAGLCSNHPRSDDYRLFLYLEYLQNLILPSETHPSVLQEWPIDLSYVAHGCNYRQISSTSEDLLLLSFRQHLFVCNPFTKESVCLPPFLYRPRHRSSIVCEPNQGHIYRVVNYDVTDLCLCLCNVFVSETGTWKDVKSETMTLMFDSDSRPVAYGGKLHWFNGKDCMIYDPFQDNISFISGPQVEEIMDQIIHPTYCLGVVHGSLTLCLLDHDECGPIDLCYIIIWELDCELGQWILKSKSWFQPPDRPDTQDIEIRALHPTKDIVYFTMSGGIGLHDLSKGSDNFSKVLLPDVVFRDFFSRSFLFSRPWRSTSVCYHGSECYNNSGFPALDESPEHSYNLESWYPGLPDYYYYSYGNMGFPAPAASSRASSDYNKMLSL